MSRLQPGTDLGDSGLEVLENGGLLTARMPAVLVEPVFLSNPRKPRASPTRVGERLEAIAAAVAEGVDAWLRSKRLGPLETTGVSGPVPGAVMTAEDPLLAAPRGSAARALVSALQAEARRPEEVRATSPRSTAWRPSSGLTRLSSSPSRRTRLAGGNHRPGQIISTRRGSASPVRTSPHPPGRAVDGGARPPGAPLPLRGRADSTRPSPGALRPTRSPLRRGAGGGASTQRQQPGGSDRTVGDRPGLRGTCCSGGSRLFAER